MHMTQHFIAKTFTPILNTEQFSEIFGRDRVILDDQGLVRAVESIAFPGTKFSCLKKIGDIFQVTTQEYPYPGNFFVDGRLLSPVSAESPARTISLPSRTEILQTLYSLLGTRYFWGGNCPGVPEMSALYPAVDTSMDRNLIGFDCSGLMYFASNGYTPRNTSSWVHFGDCVKIENLSISAICEVLEPLDAIVWPGHILFVYDESSIIESRLSQGVILSRKEEKLSEIFQTRIPRDSWEKDPSPQFLVRRWYPHS